MSLQLLAFLLLVGWSAGAVTALLRVRRRVVRSCGDFAPVSVLKPLCGSEPELEANLRTFFELDHPAYELVFGARDAGDPALLLARRLSAEHPQVCCRFVVRDAAAGELGLNPKVSNLRGMLGEVRHDWLVISDSNVRVGRSWLRELAAVASQPGTGLAFNLVGARGDGTLSGELAALQLNTSIAAGCAIATEWLDHPAVIGKSLMFRRSLFDALGGFESVSSLLAEDYVMGRMFATARYRVCIARSPVENSVSNQTLRNVLGRQLRWAMLRSRLHPLAYALEPLSGIVPLLALSLLAPRSSAALLLAAAAVVTARDIALTLWMSAPTCSVRGLGATLAQRLAWTLALAPVRELTQLGIWALGPFLHHVQWRGRRLRLSAGTRLYLEEPLSEPEPTPAS